MSTFLVRLCANLPGDMDPEVRADLRDRSRGQLADWPQVWRVTGSDTLVVLVDAPDHEALHQQIAALPLHPWLEVTVEPLSPYPG
ncbi:muconolactone delta-isomerase [Corynebacterium hylobatis]|uniref:Muconolactone delta-isomerase n=1 Tax=Corynebacterium hylobatis TaxID=1859290 RepID=A0A3R9ZDB3_9CORY|nr:muconolactone Delta-isomerase family protein [Corynebacterium hylobatis]RSZ63115.1 muconolactone delta-isomerase [Corynebacterium hylobatis]